jgi:murein DD-endopeptidase MepM/ murein hydrolase activator NlpD
MIFGGDLLFLNSHMILLRLRTLPKRIHLFISAASCVLALGSCAFGPVSQPKARSGNPSPAETFVKVTTEHQGGATRFFVENDEYCEVTMTFQMGLVNLKGNKRFPYTATFPPRQKTEAFEVTPETPGVKWEFNYTNYYRLGSNCALHNDSYSYQLPYAPGDTFKVTQGYNGKFSHTGSNQYALDWDMPEGTLVRAARGGLVVRVKDNSDQGGPSVDFDRYNNYVLIRHDDGTLAHYCHLQKDGCLVKVGQTVAAGDVIAHSGNTGFSSGPHLHFCVFKTKDGRSRVSLAVKFRTDQQKTITLTAGNSYRAAEIQNPSARSSSNPT